MTMLPIYKICPKCRRRYLWNPDIGRVSCPNCSGMGKDGGKMLGMLLKGIIGKK